LPPPAEFAEPDWTKIMPESKAPRKPKEPERDPDESIEHFTQRVYRWEKQMQAYELRRQAINGTRFVKKRASAEWQRVVPVLRNSVGLSDVDHSLVKDYCICVARLEWCEHELSREGLKVLGQRGETKNGLQTTANGYRAAVRTYTRELGLSPSARTSIPARPDDDGDESDPFD
jgi:phage terminase, small subunit, putative, P27 family